MIYLAQCSCGGIGKISLWEQSNCLTTSYTSAHRRVNSLCDPQVDITTSVLLLSLVVHCSASHEGLSRGSSLAGVCVTLWEQLLSCSRGCFQNLNHLDAQELWLGDCC